MEPSAGTFVPKGGSRAVYGVDMPGSGRLRARLVEEAASAAALVCVLDGTQLAAQAREAAQSLYDVLSHPAVARRMPPLLILVNKSDAGAAATPAAARKALEQEVPRIRLARTTMEDTSGRSKPPRGGIAHSSAGESFSFDMLGNDVAFAACSATKPDVEALVAFTIKHGC